MRIFRRRKKYDNRDGASGKEPLPDIVYQMGAEAAARYVAQDPYGPNIIYGSRDRFDVPPPYPYVAVPEPEYDPFDGMADPALGSEVRSGSPINMLRSALRLNRSGSSDRFLNDSYDRHGRAGSPEHFGRGSRPGSPERMQARVGSPYLFAQPSAPRVASPLQYHPRSRTGSPEVFRRLQRAQHSQDLQRAEREQKQKQRENMMGAYQAQYMPQYQQVQQPLYPMMNYNGNQAGGWNMQQPQIYPYF